MFYKQNNIYFDMSIHEIDENRSDKNSRDYRQTKAITINVHTIQINSKWQNIAVT